MGKGLRRSMLYIPGNNPAMIQDATIYGADAVVFDLEDSITYTNKDGARNLIKNALASLDFNGVEVIVRINPLSTEFGRLDLDTIVPLRPDAIRLPKVESRDEIEEIDYLISQIEEEYGIIKSTIKIMAMIETARGVLNAREIALANSRITALTIGAEDLTANLGVSRSDGGDELLYARSMIVLAAKEANIDVIDSVYSNVNDLTGLIEETKKAKDIGFSGKAVIHPLQIEPVHKVFKPEEKEIREARKIIKAAREAEEKGIGVVTVNGKMVDKPVIIRARNILKKVGL